MVTIWRVPHDIPCYVTASGVILASHMPASCYVGSYYTRAQTWNFPLPSTADRQTHFNFLASPERQLPRLLMYDRHYNRADKLNDMTTMILRLYVPGLPATRCSTPRTTPSTSSGSRRLTRLRPRQHVSPIQHRTPRTWCSPVHRLGTTRRGPVHDGFVPRLSVRSALHANLARRTLQRRRRRPLHTYRLCSRIRTPLSIRSPRDYYRLL